MAKLVIPRYSEWHDAVWSIFPGVLLFSFWFYFGLNAWAYFQVAQAVARAAAEA